MLAYICSDTALTKADFCAASAVSTGLSGNQSKRQGKGLTELITALSGRDQRGGSISHDNKRLILLPYIWSKPILILPGSLCTQPL